VEVPTLDHLRVVTDHHDENIQRMRTVHRFSSLNIHHRESVAEHVWFVSMYAMLYAELYEQYKFSVHRDNKTQTIRKEHGILLPKIDYQILLQRVIIHDLDECLSGDFLRKFKYSTPEVHKAIRGATKTLATKLFDQIVPGDSTAKKAWFATWDHDKANDVEGRILEWCDFLSVVSYSVTEVRMGNRNFYAILSECLGYMREVVDKPEPMYARNGEGHTHCSGWRPFIRAQYNGLIKAVETAVLSVPVVDIPPAVVVHHETE
jgi:5'-deoxynucleotidase YfbR-like HD superfamily hydrolase